MTANEAILKSRRSVSREMVQSHYHLRGWQSPYARYRELLQGILPTGGAVLDVGCGRSFPMAEPYGQWGAAAHGIDPEAEDVEDVPGCTLRRASAYAIPYEPETFDVVTSQSVLEHLDRPEAAFSEMHRVLKPGGRMVFLAANKFDYSVMAMLLPNSLHQPLVKKTEGRDEQDTFPTFYWANTRRKFVRLAEGSSFAVERFEYLNQYPYALLFSPFLCRLGIWDDQFIGRHAGLHWLRGWILGCLRKRDGISE